jgi:hypothetical protein
MLADGAQGDLRARRASSRWSGLMNIQFAIKDSQLYVLEVNPRASRTVPFVAKAIGVPLAKLAAKMMAGDQTEADLGFTQRGQTPKHWCVKEAVFPFNRFPGATIMLRPGDAVHGRGHGPRRRSRRGFCRRPRWPPSRACRSAGNGFPLASRIRTKRRR